MIDLLPVATRDNPLLVRVHLGCRGSIIIIYDFIQGARSRSCWWKLIWASLLSCPFNRIYKAAGAARAICKCRPLHLITARSPGLNLATFCVMRGIAEDHFIRWLLL